MNYCQAILFLKKLITNEITDIFLEEKSLTLGLVLVWEVKERQKNFGIKDYILRILGSCCYFCLIFFV